MLIDLPSSAVRDLKRAVQFSQKDPDVKLAQQELSKLRSKATADLAKIESTVEKICAQPLVDCTKGKAPDRYCSHDVADQVANLKNLSRAYVGLEDVRRVNQLLTRLRKMPGYKEGNTRAMAMCQIDMAKMAILQGKYWDAFRGLRLINQKTKDDCVKEFTQDEMSLLQQHPKVGAIIKMNLEAEEFAKKQAKKQMESLEQARSKCQTDPAQARRMYEKIIQEDPLSAAAKLARQELAKMSGP